MKRVISVVLIAIMLLSLMPCLSMAAEEVQTAVITNNAYACIENGNETQTSLRNDGGFEISSSKQNPVDPTNPVKASYWKYDLSQYLKDDTIEIKSATMLFYATSYSYGTSIKMYDCPSNDLVTGSNYSNVPAGDSEIAQFSIKEISSVAQDYTGVNENYNKAVDITTYVKTKISEGNTSFTYMLYPGYAESTYLFPGEPVLYITYGEVADTNIIEPKANVYIRSDSTSNSSPTSNGGGLISSDSTIDVANPKKALFYKFDLSKYTDANIGLEKVEILQCLEPQTYSRKIDIYDCPQNDLANGQDYTTVTKTSSDNLIYSVSIAKNGDTPVPETVDKTLYPGISYDYNFVVDITDYVKEKISLGENSFTYMMYPGFGSSTYMFTSAPVLYVTPGEVNADVPVAEFVSNNTIYSDRIPFTEQIRATDANGIGSVDVYLNGAKMNGSMTQNGDVYTFKAGAPNAGTYTMNVIVSDKYGKSTTITKTIEVKMSRVVLEPTAWAYTLWEDETQTSQMYTPEGKQSGYWIYSNGTGSDHLVQGSDYWTKPKRALYHRFELKEYLDMGYTVSKVYLSQGGPTGGSTGAILLDCPDNDLETGDNYLTVPAHETETFIEKFSIGEATETYYNSADMQLICPGVRETNNFAVDITDYVKGKIIDGKTGFTFMEYPRYIGGSVWLTNTAQLYVELSKKSTVSIIDTASSIVEGEKFILSAIAEDDAGISKVDFYLDDTLVATAQSGAGNVYSAKVDAYPNGTYTLKAVAENDEGGVTVATKSDFVISGKSTEISEQDISVSEPYGMYAIDGTDYLYVPQNTTVSTLQAAVTTTEGCDIVAYSVLGEELGDDDLLVPGTIAEIYNADKSKLIAQLVITENGYMSNITLDISYPQHSGVATVDMYTPDATDLSLMVAAYKDDTLVDIAVESYKDIVGTKTLTAEVERGNANRFKAFLWNENMTSLKAFAERKTQVVILRFDDFSIWSYNDFDTVMDYLTQENIPGAFGVIGKTLDADNEENYETTNYEGMRASAESVLLKARDNNLIEIWSHGYEHTQAEFNEIIDGGNDYDAQLASLQKAVDLMAQYDIEITTFAPPNDSCTQTTVSMISENFPKIKTLMHFGYYTMPDGIINLMNDADVEDTVGVISYDFFVENYWKVEDAEYIQLLSHPGIWDENSWNEFYKIVEFLKSRGAIFMTPTQYHNSITEG